jgi:hypothetical protein
MGALRTTFGDGGGHGARPGVRLVEHDHDLGRHAGPQLERVANYGSNTVTKDPGDELQT